MAWPAPSRPGDPQFLEGVASEADEAPPPDSDTVGAVVLGSGALGLAEQAVISWWQTLGTALIPGWRDGWGRRPLPARLLTACAGHVTPPDSLVTGSLGSGPPGLDPCPLS